MSLSKRAIAEFIGTFWLVFGGCGSAVLAAGFPSLGIGFLGVALAFGLTVLTMAFAIGHISGSGGIGARAEGCSVKCRLQQKGDIKTC
jgi:aquaporin Z